MALQNQITTMSAAATIAPIVLWSDRCQNNLYLAGKNTFLEFYTDEDKAIKRSACARSASADSRFKSSIRSSQSTAASTNRSSSPSSRSMSSGDNDVKKNAEPQTPEATPPYRWGDLDASENENLMATMRMVFDGEADSEFQASAGYAPQREASPTCQWGDVNANDDLMATMGTTMSFDGDIDPELQMPAGYAMSPMSPCGPMMPIIMPIMMPMLSPMNQSRKEQKLHKKQDLPAKKQDLKKLNKRAPAREITTLMMRGIPCSLTQEALLALIDDVGLKDKYNFFYLPRDGKRSSNLGYAFINFVDQQSAELCTAAFTGVRLAPARSKKTCAVTPADIQGLPGLSKHFQCSAVSRGPCGPVFFQV